MLTIRVKQTADDEVEITVLPATCNDKSTPGTSPALQERGAATALKNFLKEGKRSARDCQSFLKCAGFNVETMNLTRVRRHGDLVHWQEEGKSWWALLEPLRAASVELKNFLKDAECPATECQKHLQSAGINPDTPLWLLLRYAGVAVTEREGQSWWSLSTELAEIAESCGDWFNSCLAEGLELIDEDNCGYVGWGSR